MTQISIDRDWLNKLWYDHKFKYTVVKKKSEEAVQIENYF